MITSAYVVQSADGRITGTMSGGREQNLESADGSAAKLVESAVAW